MTNLELTIKALRHRVVTLDCNVLLLFVIGSVGKKHISKFKRTRIFNEDDYDLLRQLTQSSFIVLSPNVLTEASNLLESYNQDTQPLGLSALQSLIKKTEEHYHSSSKLVDLNAYKKFGLADASIEALCKNEAIAITVDLPLYGYLYSKSLAVINFNHVRMEIG